MEVICGGRVRFDIDRQRIVVEPEGKGVEELEPGMRVWIVVGDPHALAPIQYKITDAGRALISA